MKFMGDMPVLIRGLVGRGEGVLSFIGVYRQLLLRWFWLRVLLLCRIALFGVCSHFTLRRSRRLWGIILGILRTRLFRRAGILLLRVLGTGIGIVLSHRRVWGGLTGSFFLLGF